MSGWNLPDGCSDADIDAQFYDPTPDECERCGDDCAGELCFECEEAPDGACPEYHGVTGRLRRTIARLAMSKDGFERHRLDRIRRLRIRLIGEYRTVIRLERAGAGNDRS